MRRSPLKKGVRYFDHNATAPLHPAAREAWLAASEQFPGNPSSPHRWGQRAEAALAGARQQVAGILGCDALDLVWTSGATESANAVFHHAAHAAAPGTEAWLSAIEHPCVIEAARRHFPRTHHFIPVTREGVADLNWLEQRLGNAVPAVVALMAANNETGVLQPWREARELCRRVDAPFFCDAVQWLGRLPAQELGGCDFVSASAHKFGGPRGMGFLKVPSQGRFEPMHLGGAQEDGRRAGTENVAGALAMVAALNARQKAMTSGDFSDAKTQFESQLVSRLPGCVVVGAGAPRLWNTLSVVMPEADCRSRWVVKLDKAGFAVSTGSACASGKESPSHVLLAMGFDAAAAGRALRFSGGPETAPEDWAALLEALITLAATG